MPFILAYFGIMLGKWSVFFPIIFLGVGIFLLKSFVDLSKGGGDRSQFYFSYFFSLKFFGSAFFYLALAFLGFYGFFTTG